MPIDVNLLREGKEDADIDAVRRSEAKRQGSKPQPTVDEAIRLDKEWRGLLQQVELLREEKNKMVAQVAKAKAPPSAEQREQSKGLSANIAKLELDLASLATQRDEAILRIGNILHDSVPAFEREEDHEACVTSWGEFTPHPDHHPHHQALWMLGAYEPERGSAVAGHRGYYLRGIGVLLSQALISYATDFLLARNFEPVQPPYFMTKSCMKKVSQLSDFEDSLYRLDMGDSASSPDAGGAFLIATSEQPLCCFHANETLPLSSLPLRYAGISPCFRKEAGKFGVDTWGIFRVHQFDKVEQFVVCEPDSEKSYAMLEQLRVNAEDFLKSLELPFKTINVVSGELNLAAAKKYDINAWFPVLGAHKELVSASNCLDYQSRATDTFTLTKEGIRRPVHLLNATLCALTRTICALVENHQTTTPEGVRGVRLPQVLAPYFKGHSLFLPFVREERDFALQRPATKTEARKKGEAMTQERVGGVSPAKTPTAAAAAAAAATVTTAPTKDIKQKAKASEGAASANTNTNPPRFSFTVEGTSFPTNVTQLQDQDFPSVASYVEFLTRKH